MIADTINVLLVEDDDDDIVITRHLLSQAGTQNFQVDTAESLQSAFGQITQKPPHVILLDLSLPDSQGWQTLISTLSHAPEIPVILLTGLADESMGIKSVQVGAQDYLFKGHIDRDRLARAIHYAIERKRSELALKRYRDHLEEMVNERTAELRQTNAQLTVEMKQRKLAEKHTEDAKNYLESVIRTSRDGIMVVDDQGAFEFGNEAFVTTLGWPREELIGESFLKVVPEDQHTFILERWDEVQRDDGTPYEVDILTKEGERRALAVSHQRMILGGESKYCVVFSDITERKRRENELRDANERLRAHDQARTEFVSNVSHELKTPLASMGYAIDNLLKGIVGPLPDRAVTYIKMLKEDSQRLGRTVGDILDLSRIESKTIRLDRVRIPLTRLVRRTVDSLRIQAVESNLSLSLSLNGSKGFADCDPQKVERLLLNLIRNAVKFTPPQGAVDVSLRTPKGKPDLFELRVTDSGIGISSEHIDKVTDRYFRVGEQVDGTGLGLAICKDIVELHGGSLAICSPPPDQPTGAQVSICLPKSSPPHVLAVDDCTDTAQVIGKQLESEGYAVASAANGVEALAFLEQQIPDIIITDLVMPVMDGISMIAEIKAHPEWRHVPIIAITGGELDRTRREILEGFSIPALEKPWLKETLLDLIESAVFGMRYLNAQTASGQ
ncbi:MAG: response regulator [Verrucomicrobia bacterium]|jgi:PAS domain S-box-containing protein|nr:response regulator [Verrucomicrobiota bacterium]